MKSRAIKSGQHLLNMKALQYLYLWNWRLQTIINYTKEQHIERNEFVIRTKKRMTKKERDIIVW